MPSREIRRRLRSTNIQERLNEEIRRRERVIRIFPNDDAAIRLVGAMLMDVYECWQERRYLDMTEYHADFCGSSRALAVARIR